MNNKHTLVLDNIDTEWIERIVRQSGEIALSHFKQVHAERKSDSTPVTIADRQIEDYLRDQLSAAFPEDGLLGEERKDHKGSNDRVWAIDPIDGTASYAAGLPVWGISLGLLRNWQPVFGVFYMPLIDELYMGYADRATLNGKPIHVDDSQHIDSQSFLCVTAETHRAFEIHFQGKTRSLGSTAAHACFAARGTAVAALLGQVALWDVAGALPIVKAAGGGTQYLHGNGDDLDLESMADGRKFPHPLLTGSAWALDYFSSRITERKPD